MDETPNQEVEAGKAPGKKWRTVVVAGALVISLATAVAFFLFHRSAAGAEAKPKTEPKAKSVMHLDPFVVNLADAEGDRFLRVGIDLGLDREAKEGGHPDQAAMLLARTRDTILSILTTCNAEALVSANGKAVLKERLTTALRERAPELGVREIYFTEFLVQR
jgi:flagellar FliL protein